MGRFYPKHDLIEVPEYISNDLEFSKKIHESYSHKLTEIDKDLDKLFQSGNKYTLRQNHFSILNQSIDYKKLNQAYLNAFTTLDHFCHKLSAKKIDGQILKIEKFKDYLNNRLDKVDFQHYETKLNWYYLLNTRIDEKKVDTTIKKPVIQFLKTQKMFMNPKVEEVRFNFINAGKRLYEMNTTQIESLKKAFSTNKIALVNLISNDIHPSDFSPFIVVSIKENENSLTLILLHSLDKHTLKSWKILKHKNQYENLTREELLKLNGIVLIDYLPELPPLKPIQKFFRRLGFHHISWGIKRSMMYLKFKLFTKIKT